MIKVPPNRLITALLLLADNLGMLLLLEKCQFFNQIDTQVFLEVLPYRIPGLIEHGCRAKNINSSSTAAKVLEDHVDKNVSLARTTRPST